MLFRDPCLPRNSDRCLIPDDGTVTMHFFNDGKEEPSFAYVACKDTDIAHLILSGNEYDKRENPKGALLKTRVKETRSELKQDLQG
ncbi:hypothetical protein DL769_003492 [Monosporascus sp. CRB-8-3]|nr:hypothetical protein DL769_003492 [Monosporascus sp. CRB-8-3]